MKTLTNPTHAAIDAAVAEHVARWKPEFNRGAKFTATGIEKFGGPPPYSTSADAVLGLLNGYEWAAMRQYGAFLVSLDKYFSTSEPHGEASTLPMAACIALLRAHGVTVELTEEGKL